MNIFGTNTDAEFDIEDQRVISVERRGCDTAIEVASADPEVDNSIKEVRCSMAKHNDFVTRFRAKLNRRDAMPTGATPCQPSGANSDVKGSVEQPRLTGLIENYTTALLPYVKMTHFELRRSIVAFATEACLRSGKVDPTEHRAALASNARLRQLLKDCEAVCTNYLVPDTKLTPERALSQLIELLDGPQQRAAEAPTGQKDPVLTLTERMRADPVFAALVEANDICRSAFHVAQRATAPNGQHPSTNWEAFKAQLDKVLKKQYAIIYQGAQPADKPEPEAEINDILKDKTPLDIERQADGSIKAVPAGTAKDAPAPAAMVLCAQCGNPTGTSGSSANLRTAVGLICPACAAKLLERDRVMVVVPDGTISSLKAAIGKLYLIRDEFPEGAKNDAMFDDLAVNLKALLSTLEAYATPVKLYMPSSSTATQRLLTEALNSQTAAEGRLADTKTELEACITAHDAVCTMVSRFLVAWKGHIADSWMDGFIKEAKAVTYDPTYPTGFIAPYLWSSKRLQKHTTPTEHTTKAVKT